MTNKSNGIGLAEPNGRHGRLVVTPAIATEILANPINATNPRGKSVASASFVDKYGRQMVALRWFPDMGLPLMFGPRLHKAPLSGRGFEWRDRQLRNGFTRLTAIAKYGVTIDFPVIYDVTEEEVAVVDTGSPRNASDLLRFHGFANCNALAATARLIAWHDQRARIQLPTRLPSQSPQEILDIVLRESDLPSAVSVIYQYRIAMRLVTPSVLSFVYFNASRVDAACAIRFLEAIDQGIDLGPANAALALRNRMIENDRTHAKLPPEEILALAIKAWNYFRHNRPIKYLRWRRSGPQPEDFPEFE